MPKYEYKCPKCGEFEIEHSIKEEARTECPECGETIQRLISICSFELKGSGWYKTDYPKSTMH